MRALRWTWMGTPYGWARELRFRKKEKRQFTGNCPIREHTGDGDYVGRCDYATYDRICPRHGFLSDYLDDDDRTVDPQHRRFQ